MIEPSARVEPNVKQPKTGKENGRCAARHRAAVHKDAENELIDAPDDRKISDIQQIDAGGQEQRAQSDCRTDNRQGHEHALARAP